jgi:membrane-associated phospholipid phosphatase
LKLPRQAAIFFVLLTFGGLAAPAQELPSSEAPRPAPDLSRFLPHEDFDRDGARTLGAFPKNLGRSFIGVFSKDNLGPLLAGTAAAGASSLFDQQAGFRLLGQAPGISKMASTAGGGKYMIPATVGLFAAGRFAQGSTFRAFSYDATQAIIVSSVYTGILKKAVGRTRPDGSDNLSFPSGHTSTAFAWATVAQSHYGWKVGAPSYLAASAIGLSRISNNKHNLSDVVAGATIGYITGRTAARTNGEATRRQRTFNLHPMTDASGTGMGLGATVSW